MATTTFSGPVRSKDGFDAIKTNSSGAVTSTMSMETYVATITVADGATTGKESAIVGRNVAFTAFPKVMSRLVKTALDNSERAYARNDASKTIINYVLEKEKMELYGAKLDVLETKVAALEGSKIVFDVDAE